MLHSILMHVKNAQAHEGAFICFWLLCMNLERKNSKMCLLYSQSRICNYFHLWYNVLHHILKTGGYGHRSMCFCNFGICNFGLLPFLPGPPWSHLEITKSDGVSEAFHKACTPDQSLFSWLTLQQKQGFPVTGLTSHCQEASATQPK